MNRLWVCLLFFLLYGLVPASCLGQDPKDAALLYRLETLDGNEYIGTLASQTADTVRLKTEKLDVD